MNIIKANIIFNNSKGIGFIFLIAFCVLAGIAVIGLGHIMSSGSGYRQTKLTGMRTNSLFLCESAIEEAMVTLRKQANSPGTSLYADFRSGASFGPTSIPVPHSISLASKTGLKVWATVQYRKSPFLTKNGKAGGISTGVNGPNESCGLILLEGSATYVGDKFSDAGNLVIRRWIDTRVINTRYSPLTQFSFYLRNGQRQFQKEIPSHANLGKSLNRYEYGIDITGSGGDVLLGGGTQSEGPIYFDMPQGILADELGQMCKNRNASRRIPLSNNHIYPQTMKLDSPEWTAWADYLRGIYLQHGVDLFKTQVTWTDLLGEEHTDEYDAYPFARQNANFSMGIAKGNGKNFVHYYKSLGLIGEYSPTDTEDPHGVGIYDRHMPYLMNKAPVPTAQHVATSIEAARDKGKNTLPFNPDWDARKIYGLGIRRALLYSSVYMDNYTVTYKGQEFSWGDPSGTNDLRWFYMYPLYFNGISSYFNDPYEKKLVDASARISTTLLEVDMIPANEGSQKMKMQIPPNNLVKDGPSMWEMEIGCGIYTNKQSLLFKNQGDLAAIDRFKLSCIRGDTLIINGIVRIYDRLDLDDLGVKKYRGQGILIANSISLGKLPLNGESSSDFLMLVARGTAEMNANPSIPSNTPSIFLGPQRVEAMLVGINSDGKQSTLGVNGNGALILVDANGADIKGSVAIAVIGALSGKTKIEYDSGRLANKADDPSVLAISFAGRPTAWQADNK